MLALIAGTGDLPPALVARLDEAPLICALQGFTPDLPVDITFRMEHLGSFLQELQQRGVTQICMAGAVRRPDTDPSQIDAATLPLIPKVQAAMAKGDDGALRVIIGLLEEAGFAVIAAHQIAPDLLPTQGTPTRATADAHVADAAAGEACVAAMGVADSGQACVVRDGAVIATEGPDGTEAMLSGLQSGASAILFKAPKPGQDRRADLPLIGPDTARQAVAAGLAGIVIEADGVMVLDLPQVVQALDAQDMFLWIRPKGAA